MEAIYLGWFLLVLPLTAAGAILLHLHRKPDMAIFASIGAASLMLLIAALVGNRHHPAAGAVDLASAARPGDLV